MCYVTATELKNNLSHYLKLSKKEDVFITKNNKIISVLVNPQLKALYEVCDILNKTEIDNTVTESDEDIILQGIDKR